MSLRRSLRDTSARLDALRREALAMARQTLLMRHDVRAVAPVRATLPVRGEDVALLVHGFLATAGVLRPLGEALEAEGVTVTSFTHAPGLGVTALAARVAEQVQRVEATRIHLVGHSIGGLAVRWFVQELGGDTRVVGTTSLASPFWGVAYARALPGTLAREIEPGSAVLATLRAGLGRGVPHFAVSGTHDAVVGAPAALGAAAELVADGCGHNAVLYDPGVLASVVRRVHAARGGESAGAGRL